MIDTQDAFQTLDLASVYDREATVPQLFLEAVTFFPDRIALEGSEGRLSYCDLLSYAQQVQQVLHSLRVKPGDVVAIVDERRFATIGAILAILMSGAAYFAVEVAGRVAADIEAELAGCGARLLIGDAERLGQLSLRSCAIAWLPRINSVDMPIIGSDLLPAGQQAGDMACVLCTSGSATSPKAVIIPHRAIVRLVSAQIYARLDSQQVLLLHTPLKFAPSLFEIWGALLHGGRLVLAPARELAISDYRNLVSEYRVSTLWLPAAIFHQIGDADLQSFAPLQQLLVGGDTVSPARVCVVKDALAELAITYLYGSTENTVFTSYYPVPVHQERAIALPIGKPIAHTRAYVLDEQQNPVQGNGIGELAVGGDGLAVGYLHDPTATTARFINLQVEGLGPERIFLTGDRARQDDSGDLHFLGRLDRKVDIEEQRVDLNWIESILTSLLPNHQSAVELIEGPDEGREIVAFLEGEATPGRERQLREQLLNQLPRAALPAKFVFRATLPIHASGKIDRDRLRRELLEPPASPVEPEAAPSMAAESKPDQLEVVSEIWTRLLNRPEVRPDDNFFEMGGDSLLLIQMHQKLAHAGVKIELADLFAATTPRQIADLIENRATQRKSPAA